MQSNTIKILAYTLVGPEGCGNKLAWHNLWDQQDEKHFSKICEWVLPTSRGIIQRTRRKSMAKAKESDGRIGALSPAWGEGKPRIGAEAGYRGKYEQHDDDRPALETVYNITRHRI
jgi:hypothetical protein